MVDFVGTPDLSQFVKKTDIPAPADTSQFATKAEIPNLSPYAKTTDLSVFATKNVLDGQFTIAQLMALDPAANVRKYAWCSDLYGIGDMMLSDGSNWKPVRPFGVQNIANADQNLTLTTLINPPTVFLKGTMTASRTITIPVTNAYPGARFRIVRNAAGALVSSIINGLNLSVNNWLDMEYDGTAFVKTASGGLL